MVYLLQLISNPDTVVTVCRFPYYTVKAVIGVLNAIPVALACILLNKYIFKSAEMIDGAING